jgi:cytochrome c biogenesis protein CcdA
MSALLPLSQHRRTTRTAALLLVAYTIGAALPMLAVAYGGQAISRRPATTTFAPFLANATALQRIYLLIAPIEGAEGTGLRRRKSPYARPHQRFSRGRPA